jgi:hypothetical protein
MCVFALKEKECKTRKREEMSLILKLLHMIHGSLVGMIHCKSRQFSPFIYFHLWVPIVYDTWLSCSFAQVYCQCQPMLYFSRSLILTISKNEWFSTIANVGSTETFKMWLAMILRHYSLTDHLRFWLHWLIQVILHMEAEQQSSFLPCTISRRTISYINDFLSLHNIVVMFWSFIVT